MIRACLGRLPAPPPACRQYRALLAKHAALARRAPLATLAQACAGAAVIALLVLFQLLADSIIGAPVPHPPTLPVSALPRCVPGPGSVRPAGGAGAVEPGCSTLVFVPDAPLARAVMRGVAGTAGLVFGHDVLALPGATRPPYGAEALAFVNATQLAANASATCASAAGSCADPAAWLSGDCLPCALALDNRTLATWLAAHPNSTQNAVFFFGAYVNESSYSLHYNLSLLSFPWLADAHTQSLKAALDTAMLAAFANGTAAAAAVASATNAAANAAAAAAGGREGGAPLLVDLRIGLRSFPRPAQSVRRPGASGGSGPSYDVFAANGGLWLFTVPGVLFFFLLTEIVHEKESGLRAALATSGLRPAVYWAAWATHAALLVAASCLLLQLAGGASGFAFFALASPVVTLALFASFGAAMSGLAAALSALLHSARAAQAVGYSFLLAGFVFQAVVCSAYAGLLGLLYAPELEARADAASGAAPGAPGGGGAWLRAGRALLMAYPPFPFALVFSAVAARTSAAAAAAAAAGTTAQGGPGEVPPATVAFRWADLQAPQRRAFLGFECDLPPAATSLLALWADAVVFALLAVYLDAVVPGPAGGAAGGAPRHPLFCLGCRYRHGAAGPRPRQGSAVAAAGVMTRAQWRAGRAKEGAEAAGSTLALVQVPQPSGHGSDVPPGPPPATRRGRGSGARTRATTLMPTEAEASPAPSSQPRALRALSWPPRACR